MPQIDEREIGRQIGSEGRALGMEGERGGGPEVEVLVGRESVRGNFLMFARTQYCLRVGFPLCSKWIIIMHEFYVVAF